MQALSSSRKKLSETQQHVLNLELKLEWLELKFLTVPALELGFIKLVYYNLEQTWPIFF